MAEIWHARTDWTEERTERAKSLWQNGASASEIANDLGGVTRSAVLGKIHRCGLSNRTKITRAIINADIARKSNHKKRRRKVVTLPRAGSRLAPFFTSEPLPPPHEFDVGRKTLLELDDHDCKFPVGEDNPMKFCALPRIPGLPYCPNHSRRAYSAPPVRDQIKPFRQWVLHKGGTYRMKKEFA